MDDRDALLALAAELDDVDVDRLDADFAGAASLQALRADMSLARRPDRVAVALGKTAVSPGERGPRFTTPTCAFEAAGGNATVPGFQPLEAYEVVLHDLAPELERRDPVEPATFLAKRAGEPYAAAELAAATGRTANQTAAALDELAARGLVPPDHGRRRRPAVVLRRANDRAAVPAGPLRDWRRWGASSPPEPRCHAAPGTRTAPPGVVAVRCARPRGSAL
jgi:hypothetical protein